MRNVVKEMIGEDDNICARVERQGKTVQCKSVAQTVLSNRYSKFALQSSPDRVIEQIIPLLTLKICDIINN